MNEMRDRNRKRVIEAALQLFLEKGVENVTIKEISVKSQLTERSVYRYFYSRADLVLASSFLFWERTRKKVEQLVDGSKFRGMKGIDQIAIMLKFYSSLFIDSPESVRFIYGAEMELDKAEVEVSIQNRPPGAFEDSHSPLVEAIHTGLADGSVSSKVDVKELYYMIYDSILGTMQRIMRGASKYDQSRTQKRMDHLCSMFIAAFQGKV